MRVVVTGAAGFIGGNMLRELDGWGIDDIVAVDDLEDARKVHNLAGAHISDYIDQSEFYDMLESGRLGHFDAILHEGACSDTMEHNGRLMMDRNYRCSRRLLDYTNANDTSLLYASSAAVYGNSTVFVEDPRYERPLNVYGYSKLLFDNVVRRRPAGGAQVAGFRYFNVYGPGEAHKDRMASVAFHHMNQLRDWPSAPIRRVRRLGPRRAESRFCERCRRREGKAVVSRASRDQRNLQSRDGARAAFQRRRAGRDQFAEGAIRRKVFRCPSR